MMSINYIINWLFGHSGLPVAVKVVIVMAALAGVVFLYAIFSLYNYKIAKLYGFSDWMVRMCWIPIFNIVPSTYIFAYAISKVFDTRIKETILFAAVANFFLIINYSKLTLLTDRGIPGLIASVIAIFVYTTFYLYYSQNPFIGLIFSVIGLIPATNLFLPLIVATTTIKHTDGYGHWEDLFSNLKGEDSEAVLLKRAEKRLQDNLAHANKIGNESDLEYKVDSSALRNIRDQKLREDSGEVERPEETTDFLSDILAEDGYKKNNIEEQQINTDESTDEFSLDLFSEEATTENKDDTLSSFLS